MRERERLYGIGTKGLKRLLSKLRFLCSQLSNCMQVPQHPFVLEVTRSPEVYSRGLWWKQPEGTFPTNLGRGRRGQKPDIQY
jgi:hypothetical protein